MHSAYVLLGLAICAVWVPAISVGRHWHLKPCLALLVAAIIAGFVTAVLQAPAMLWLGALSAAAFASQRVESRTGSMLLTGLSALLALALSLHALPGFHNALWISNVRFSADAVPFTQYLNFDKGAAGLILLAAYAPRCTTWAAWRGMLKGVFGVLCFTVVTVLGLAMLSGYVSAEFKLPAIALSFFAANLLFTCVAEEVFFRGLLQERLSKVFARDASGRWMFGWPVVLSALIFGLAHVQGGAHLVILSIVAGLGYSIAYARTGRIEAAILTHFAVNAAHFIGFTYPRLAGV